MKKAIICAFGLAVLATPALAEFGDEYWVVQDSSTKQCSVIRVRKPGFFLNRSSRGSALMPPAK